MISANKFIQEHHKPFLSLNLMPEETNINVKKKHKRRIVHVKRQSRAANPHQAPCVYQICKY